MDRTSLEPVHWHQTVGYVVAWLVSVALVVVDLLLVRGLVINGLTSIGALRSFADPDRWRSVRLTYGWTVQTIDLATLLVFCCLAIAFVIVIESYYRKGLREGQLGQRVVRVVRTQIGIGAVSTLISWFLAWLMSRGGAS